MSKNIPFMASAGNHEQEQSFAAGTKTIFTAFEKRYRMPNAPAIFTPASVTTTGGTNFGATTAGLANSHLTSPVLSYGAVGGVAQNVAISIGDAQTGATVLSGTTTEASYACQTSAGGLTSGTSAAFRGNYDYGNSYFSYDAGLAHVIFVNPYVPYEAGSLQYKWLAADLAAVRT